MTTRSRHRLGTAAPLFDRDWLAGLVDQPVRARRLRHKPGLSTLAALHRLDSDEPVGWIQITTDEHLDKVKGAVRRAQKHGTEVGIAAVPEQSRWWALFGSIESDPRLTTLLHQVDRATDRPAALALSGSAAVLRYNPGRRLVVRTAAGDVLRLATESDRTLGDDLALLETRGIPVLRPLPTPRSHRGRVTRWQWCAGGDLAKASERDPAAAWHHAVAAGASLAKLHALPATELGWGPVDVVGPLLTLVADLDHLDPRLAGVMARQVARWRSEISRRPQWQPEASVPVHGDCSGDQVLLPGEPGGGPRWSDFDRRSIGPALLDLGSFAAVEMLQRRPDAHPGDALQDPAALTPALLEGYRASQRRGADAAEDWLAALRPAIARALLLRVLEPFRAAEPEWQQAIADRLRQIDRVWA